jgi:hypothetical protein
MHHKLAWLNCNHAFWNNSARGSSLPILWRITLVGRQTNQSTWLFLVGWLKSPENFLYLDTNTIAEFVMEVHCFFFTTLLLHLKIQKSMYSLWPIVLIASMDACRHILVLDTSVFAKGNMDRREYCWLDLTTQSNDSVVLFVLVSAHNSCGLAIGTAVLRSLNNSLRWHHKPFCHMLIKICSASVRASPPRMDW